MDVHYKFFQVLTFKNTLSEVTSNFEALPDTPSKLKYVQSVLKENNLVPKIDLRHPKDDAISKIHRDKANHLYLEKNFVEALEGYNKAICYAGAEGLSFCYGNRAAVFFELKLYDECLDNIRLARDSGYPEKNLPILARREAKCHTAISIQSSEAAIKHQPKLSYPAKAQNPSVADCIELVVNKKYGRHFVAMQDLKVGDIVILEKPYQVYLRNEYNYRKCANCLIENQFNLIPCPGCTKTMFCSQSCLEAAHKFHKTLCPIADRIFERPSSHMFFALRILLSLIHDFGSLEALAAARMSRSTKTMLPKCGGNGNRRNALDAFHDMEHIFETPQLKDAISLALLYSWLTEYTDMAEQLTGVENQNTFLDLFYVYGNISKANSYATDKIERGMNRIIQNESFASNILPIISLLNHSCAPNTVAISCNESLMAALIERPVKKGEQLFISYDAHHMQEPKMIRQQQLLENYKFTCDCEACTKNYPTIFCMRQTKAPAKLTMVSNNSYQLMDYKTASRKFEDCKEYLQKNASSYPSMALYHVRLGMLAAFGVMCHNYTLSAKLE